MSLYFLFKLENNSFFFSWVLVIVYWKILLLKHVLNLKSLLSFHFFVNGFTFEMHLLDSSLFLGYETNENRWITIDAGFSLGFITYICTGIWYGAIFTWNYGWSIPYFRRSESGNSQIVMYSCWKCFRWVLIWSCLDVKYCLVNFWQFWNHLKYNRRCSKIWHEFWFKIVNHRVSLLSNQSESLSWREIDGK